MMTTKHHHDETGGLLEKKPLDDWEVKNLRKDNSNPLTTLLMAAMGDGVSLDQVHRVNRIHTTEDFCSQSELKFEIGRQNDLEVKAADSQPPQDPLEEKFFVVFEALIKELISQ